MKNDGYIVTTSNQADSFIVWGEFLPRKGYVSKGYQLFVPDTQNIGNEYQNRMFENISKYIAQIPLDVRVQIKYEVDADYVQELNQYKNDTEKIATNKWDKLIRNKIYRNFTERIKSNQMRREYLYIYNCPFEKIRPFQFFS